MFLVYTIIVIAFFISLDTMESPNSEQVKISVDDKQIGYMYVM
ncbi:MULTISPECIES: hypothetical protein [unclassified Providencia]|nr:hypothetical protein [Providencia sp.]